MSKLSNTQKIGLGAAAFSVGLAGAGLGIKAADKYRENSPDGTSITEDVQNRDFELSKFSPIARALQNRGFSPETQEAWNDALTIRELTPADRWAMEMGPVMTLDGQELTPASMSYLLGSGLLVENPNPSGKKFYTREGAEFKHLGLRFPEGSRAWVEPRPNTDLIAEFRVEDVVVEFEDPEGTKREVRVAIFEGSMIEGDKDRLAASAGKGEVALVLLGDPNEAVMSAQFLTYDHRFAVAYMNEISPMLFRDAYGDMATFQNWAKRELQSGIQEGHYNNALLHLASNQEAIEILERYGAQFGKSPTGEPFIFIPEGSMGNNDLGFNLADYDNGSSVYLYGGLSFVVVQDRDSGISKLFEDLGLWNADTYDRGDGRFYAFDHDPAVDKLGVIVTGDELLLLGWDEHTGDVTALSSSLREMPVVLK